MLTWVLLRIDLTPCGRAHVQAWFFFVLYCLEFQTWLSKQERVTNREAPELIDCELQTFSTGRDPDSSNTRDISDIKLLPGPCGPSV